jgi:hypothetical protein
MIHRSRLYPAISHITVVWEESGENLALFCYLMSWGVFAMLRSRKPALISRLARLETVCSNRSSTSSVRSTTPMASEN